MSDEKETYWGEAHFGKRFKTFADFMEFSGYVPASPPRLFTEEECEGLGKVPPMKESLALPFIKDYIERTKKDRQDG